MKTPKLYASIRRPEGRVEWPEDWNEVHPITRADVLTDWITDLQKAWINAVKDLGPKEAQRKLGYYLSDKPENCN